MTEHAKNSEQIAVKLRKMLNAHGHGFHYAVMRRAHDLADARESTGVFDGVEFPVVGGGETTHIDFILRWRPGGVYVVSECKRADPAKARWCFARAPYTWRNPRAEEVIFEQLHVTERERRVIHKPKFAYTTRGVYHLGFEMRTGSKGTAVEIAVKPSTRRSLRCCAGRAASLTTCLTSLIVDGATGGPHLHPGDIHHGANLGD